MSKNQQVERLAKQKLEKAISPKVATWDSLRDQAPMKQYYRDQARQALPGVERPRRGPGDMPEQTRRWFLGVLASLGFVSPSLAKTRGGRPGCKSCYFWVSPETKASLHRKVKRDAKLSAEVKTEPYGTCHVRSVIKWPPRFEYEWCGEHKEM